MELLRVQGRGDDQLVLEGPVGVRRGRRGDGRVDGRELIAQGAGDELVQPDGYSGPARERPSLFFRMAGLDLLRAFFFGRHEQPPF